MRQCSNDFLLKQSTCSRLKRSDRVFDVQLNVPLKQRVYFLRHKVITIENIFYTDISRKEKG